MSLDKIGHRNPSAFARVSLVEGESCGIPGSEKPPLFYQDRKRRPVADHGHGIWIYDTEGTEYLDGCSGAVVANLGHGHPRMIQAAIDQLRKIAFTYRTQFENRPANALAELLVQVSPPELDRVFFVNSGSEAVESMIKLARQFWWAQGRRGKSVILARRPSYHGSTLGALAATDYTPLNVPFRAMTMSVPKVSAPFCYHCPLEKEYPACEVACARELETAIQVHGPDNIAAFVLEPIGGSSTGAAVPPDEYFAIVERICHEYEILLLVDEVMTGCGRTGTFWGFEHWDVTPDVLATSKGLSAGYAPIGAIVASSTVVEPVLESGGFLHGHTYAGNPLSSAIALAAMREIIDGGLVERARDLGTYMHRRLRELKARHEVIGDVRGRGLMAGLEFVQSRDERKPFPANWYVALEATNLAREHGLLIYPRRSIYGLSGDHVLVAPPLIIDREGIDELIVRLDLTLTDLSKLLAGYIDRAPAQYEDQTIDRYEQSEEVPAYARGDLEGVPSVHDVNVTGGMETGHVDPREWEPPEEEEEEE